MINLETEVTLEQYSDFENLLLSVNRVEAERFVLKVLEKHRAIDVIENTIVPALEHIGGGWHDGHVSLSQVYMSGRICEHIVDNILQLESTQKLQEPKMAIAVLEDHHLLGKRIVHMVMRSGGFELADYGSVDVDALLRRVKADKIRILLISTLMLPSALRITEVRRGLNAAGCDTKIVVGGAPFRLDHRLWSEVGADAMCQTASQALGTVENLIRELS